MRVALLVPAVVVCCCVTARSAEANVRPVLRSEALPPIFVPRAPAKKAPVNRGLATPKSTPTRRAISPEMATKLSLAAARIVSPAPVGAGAPTGFTSGAREATDAVQLEPYIVEEEKFPEFKERQLLTPKGKLDLAYKRHPGLNLGPIPLFNHGRNGAALEIIEDDFRKERRKEMEELYGIMSAGGMKPPPDASRKLDDARTRSVERSHQPGTPFREPR